MARPHAGTYRPDSEETAPVTAPAAPSRTILGTILIVFGSAVVAVAAVVLIMQLLAGAAAPGYTDPLGLSLTILSGLIWIGSGVLYWRRAWILATITAIVALLTGAFATWLITGNL